LSDVQVEILGEAGRVIGTATLPGPLRLGLEDALDLMNRLDKAAGDNVHAIARPPAALAAVAEQDDDVETLEHEEERAARAEADRVAQRANLRSRAEALDLEGLYRWLQTLDASNPHMSAAYDVVTDRIAELTVTPAVERAAGPPAPEVEGLIEEARRLEAEYVALQARADDGDDLARVQATEIRSRLMQLQTDIQDGINRQDDTGEDA
jgi:hypothetical protein